MRAKGAASHEATKYSTSNALWIKCQMQTARHHSNAATQWLRKRLQRPPWQQLRPRRLRPPRPKRRPRRPPKRWPPKRGKPRGRRVPVSRPLSLFPFVFVSCVSAVILLEEKKKTSDATRLEATSSSTTARPEATGAALAGPSSIRWAAAMGGR